MTLTRIRHTFVAALVFSLPSSVFSLSGCSTASQQRFRSHIEYLASDELEGRGVGSEGIDQAADYIAAEFGRIGLEPAGDNGTFFQSFPMTLSPTLTDTGKLSFSGDTEFRKQGVDFIPYNFSSDDAFRGGIVFCGYAIVNPDKQWDDFKDVDLTGSAALMLTDEPPSWADEHGNPTPNAMLRNKIYNAKDRGAIAVLIVNTAPHEGAIDRLAEFFAEGADAYGLPVLNVSRAVIEGRVAAGGLGSLADLQKKLDDGGYASSVLAHMEVSGQAGLTRAKTTAKNVIGVLRGDGPKAGEYVVIGAHYDHLGIRRPMKRKFKDGKLVTEDLGLQIHNGADDNASGTGGVIEIARQFAASGRPARSVLFIAFSGEEAGLHGSKHFVESPTVPLDYTVAMLNMDMIGRLEKNADKVTVFGVQTGKEFAEVLDAAGRAADLGISPAIDEGGRSDHASFLRKNVPSLHFFSGNHADYHQPSDDVDKINVAGGVKIASLVYETARRIADADARPTFQLEKKKEQKTGTTTTFRVVMGLTPNYAEDGKPGMVVDGVSAEGPAEQAGMKSGDRILSIGGKSVANVYDYMASTRGNKAGDTVEVLVQRGDKQVTLQVTLVGTK